MPSCIEEGAGSICVCWGRKGKLPGKSEKPVISGTSHGVDTVPFLTAAAPSKAQKPVVPYGQIPGGSSKGLQWENSCRPVLSPEEVCFLQGTQIKDAVK